MTKDQNTPATELSDDDLDAVQGAGSRTASKGVILSSETHEPAFKRDAKGIVLSSETHEPAFKRDGKGIILHEEQETI